MMEWPYQFVKLSSAQKDERQLTLYRYGLYAQISTLFSIAFFLLLRITQKIVKKATGRGGTHDTLPTALVMENHEKLTNSLYSKLGRVLWWLGGNFEIAGIDLGSRDQLIFGTIWTAWLLCLCVNETANDYSHLSRRFGIIGSSQFPIQYLLATKRLNVIAFIFRTTHADFNRWHRVLGRISSFLVFIHGLLYLNYYVKTGGLLHAFFRIVPVLGMLGLLGIIVLNTTVLSTVRQWSYRSFYVAHIFVALTLPPLIWFHAPHSRLFMMESLVILIIDQSTRLLSIVKCPATVVSVHGTNLLEIVARVPSKKLGGFAANPASYAYLSIPSQSGSNFKHLSPSFIFLRALSNPFTVASIDEDAGKAKFVARQRQGPMTDALSRIASLGTKVDINIEGPYGSTASFLTLAVCSFDKILLVAGGVGATFILPLYEKIASEDFSTRVDLIWAVREAPELTWSSLFVSGDVHRGNNTARLFLTGNSVPEDTANIGDRSTRIDDAEMSRLEKDNIQNGTKIKIESCKRPDIGRIADELFQGEHGRVAVIVCGPAGMARDLRREVGKWVSKGRDVWFHNEKFGW